MDIKKNAKKVLNHSKYYRNNHTMGKKPLYPGKVNLEYWDYGKNLGDILSPIIVNWMLEKENIDPFKKIKRTKHLYAVGSVIGMGKLFDAVVWGAGLHTQEAVDRIMEERTFRHYDVRAVRGPETANVMRKAGYDCPEIYGDPAILMPLIYNSNVIHKEYDVSIIHHYTKRDGNNNDLHEISITTDDYKFFINELCKSKLIISSSLHGIILAESYGIPAIFLNEGLDVEFFKFKDWYYSTGRNNIVYAKNIDEAMSVKPMQIPNIITMQKELMSVFPYDLWD